MKLPSASALQRAFACPASFALPQAVEEATKEARRGTTVHAFLRRVLTRELTVEEAIGLVPVDDPGYEACRKIDVNQFPQGGHHEIALAWDVSTDEVRVLGYDIDREYEAHGANREVDIVGSFDIVGELVDKKALVLDTKSGRPAYSARESWQLRSGGVMWAKFIGADEALTGHLIVNEDVRPDYAEIDAMALAAYEQDLRSLAARMKRQTRVATLDAEDVTEGEYCKYCPAWNRCPAKTALVERMANAIGLGAQDEIKGLTPSNAAAVWRKLDQFDEVAKRMRAQVEKFASRAPIDLGDGFELRPAPGEERDTIVDEKMVSLVLERELGAEGMFVAAGWTKKSITAAVKQARGADAVKEVLGKLRDAGALVKKPGETKVREVRK